MIENGDQDDMLLWARGRRTQRRVDGPPFAAELLDDEVAEQPGHADAALRAADDFDRLLLRQLVDQMLCSRPANLQLGRHLADRRALPVLDQVPRNEGERRRLAARPCWCLRR